MELSKGITAIESLAKCDFHVEYLRDQPRDRRYYQILGVIDEHQQLTPNRQAEEFIEQFGPIPRAAYPKSQVLEIGCGCSTYVEIFRQAGYEYLGLDNNAYAQEWTSHTWDARVILGRFPQDIEGRFEAVLAPHIIEHLRNAPDALEQIYKKYLKANGHLFLIIPDDADLYNPDHLWFFNADNLHKLIEHIGFVDVRITTRRVIDREMFLYCYARKP